MPLDKRNEFIVDDDLTLGPSPLLATKFFDAIGRMVGQNRMAAVAVRERGTKTFCNVLRFMYTVPPSIQNTLNTWKVVLKPRGYLTCSLFIRSHRLIEEYQAMKDAVEIL